MLQIEFKRDKDVRSPKQQESITHSQKNLQKENNLSVSKKSQVDYIQF